MRRRDEQIRVLNPPLRVNLSDGRSGTVFLGPYIEHRGQVAVHFGTGNLVGRKVELVALDDLAQDSQWDLEMTAVWVL